MVGQDIIKLFMFKNIFLVNHKVMKKFVKSAYLKYFLVVVMIVVCGISLSGCAKGVLGYHIKNMPTKIVYQIGEEVKFDGLAIETINIDGTHNTLRFSSDNIKPVDTSTAGKKRVVIEKNNITVSFDVYVANVVVNDSDNIKDIFAGLNNGDIVYMRKGNYVAKDATDTSLKDIIINKSVTIVGDGKSNTIFGGNFVVGANFDGSVLTKIENFKDVLFLNLGFKLNYDVKNNFVQYQGPYGTTDTFGAVRCVDMQNLSFLNCSFEGYGYAIFAETISGLSVNNCEFRHIFKNAIKTTKNTKNTSIFKNAFMDIGTNVVSFDDEKQSQIGALFLSFADEGECGVSVCKNVFVRVAQHTGDVVYFDENSKTQAKASTTSLFKMSYISNSAVITLLSSTTDDLAVKGIVLGSNNYSDNLQILYLGANGSNTINQASIISIE